MSDAREAKARQAADLVFKLLSGDTQAAYVEAMKISNNEITEAMNYFAKFVDNLAEAMKKAPGDHQGLDGAKGLQCLSNMYELGATHLAHIVYGLATQQARAINLAEVQNAAKEEKTG